VSEWVEVEIRTDNGTVQISSSDDEGVSVYVYEEDDGWTDAGPIDRALVARVLVEGASQLALHKEKKDSAAVVRGPFVTATHLSVKHKMLYHEVIELIKRNNIEIFEGRISEPEFDTVYNMELRGKGT